MGAPIICKWPAGMLLSPGQRVIVDADAGTITFEECHLPSGFWKICWQNQHTCRFTDIRAIHYVSWFSRLLARGYLGPRATIVTRTGKASIDGRMTGYAEVLAALTPHVKPGGGRFF